MSATQVVVRPRAEASLGGAGSVLQELFEGIGAELPSCLSAGQSLPLLAELGLLVCDLCRGRRERACVSLYAGEEVWEIGLEVDGPAALITIFRAGACPELAVYERRVELGPLAAALAHAIDEAPLEEAPPGLLPTLSRLRGVLLAPGPSYARRPLERSVLSVTPRASSGLAFAAEAQFRKGRAHTDSGNEAQGLERADLHGLLARGRFSLICRGRTLCLSDVCLFLLAERLVMLGEEVLDAWRGKLAVFRRISVDGVLLAVRRGPGEGPLSITLGGRDAGDSGGTTFPEIDPLAFALSGARFAAALTDAIEQSDLGQSRNLRLRALARSAAALADSVSESSADDSLTNPEPEQYRAFGLPKPPKPRDTWGHGAKMRFLPRWALAVPNLDLRATFQCGERLVLGSLREIACVDRATGEILWQRAAARAASVATPFGLVRLGVDGGVALHDLSDGEIRFSAQLRPRPGAASGALVNAPGLPKLLVVAEGDRSVAAVDLVSGDVRWRFSARRPTQYRMRRAGKLLLVAGGDSALLALDVITGEVVWRVRDRLPFSGDMVVGHDSVLALSGGPIGPARLHHVDLWSGHVRWVNELDERPAPGQAPLISGEVVAIATRDRRGLGVKAYRRTDGETLWEQTPGLTSATTAWLVVDDALIGNSAAGVLLCLEMLSGVLRYSHVFSQPVHADQPRRLEPVLRNGALFVPQHRVHVVRPRDGELLGSVPSDLIPDLIRVDERCQVTVAEESGHLAAFSVAPRLSLVR